MDSNRRGKFISFEGLDGSGLTEQVELLRDWLRRKQFDANWIAFTREPSNGPVGLLLRLVLQGRLDMEEEALALLFAADRYDHLSRFVLPRLTQGIHVVSDRYYLSFYAYQAGQGLQWEWLRGLGKFWDKPDLTIVLDTPVEKCLDSIARRFSTERYEQPHILQENWRQFQHLVQVLRDDNIVVVDGSGSLEEVHQRVLRIVAPVLGVELDVG